MITDAQKNLVRKLWSLFTINVTFRKSIDKGAKHTFLGYVSLEIVGNVGTVVEGLHFYLNGLKAKILSKGFYLEMKTEPGRAAQGEKPKYWDVFAPGTAVTRTLLTLACTRDAAIKAAISEAAAMPVAGEEQSGGDVFEEAGAPADAGADPFAD